ncbi:MAG: CDP-glycerol glycerophosphotransferase family protein, partial [bacterium]
FRDNQHESAFGFTFELGIDFDKLREQIGDEYVILFRTHYFVASKFDLEAYEGFIYNVSRYNDINDLYVISDALITDYSSVFFDYANLRRPMFFYMYDLDEYKNDVRDFYIDLSTLPGPITMTQDDLVKEIKNVDHYFETYGEKYQAFHDRFNYLDDGHAAARIVEHCIVNHVDKEE